MPKGTAITNKDSFGQRLIAIRKERDMTQVQLAKAAQVTQRAISYYETDGGSPPGPRGRATGTSPQGHRRRVAGYQGEAQRGVQV